MSTAIAMQATGRSRGMPHLSVVTIVRTHYFDRRTTKSGVGGASP